MYRTFNMGIGMVLAVAENQAEEIIDRLKGFGDSAWVIGDIAACGIGEERVVLVEE